MTNKEKLEEAAKETEILPCPFCGREVDFYECDPGAQVDKIYLEIYHKEDGKINEDIECPGNNINLFECVRQVTEEKMNIAKKNLANIWNKRS